MPQAQTQTSQAPGNGREVVRPGSIGGLKKYKASEMDYWVNAMIYGEPNVGKTDLLGSANEVECFAPILVINIEDGAKTLKGRWPNVDVVTPSTFMDVQRIYDDLVKGKGCGYKSVGLDNCTIGQKRGIEYIYDQETISTDFTEFEAATWANGGWNRSSEQMRRMFDYFKRLPMHKFFIAWSKDFARATKANKEPNPKIMPLFSNALANEVPGYFDSVLYMKWAQAERGAEVRVLQAKGTSSIMAKDRDGGKKLPDVMREPTMAKMAQAWGLVA